MKNNHTQIIKFIFILLISILLSLIIGTLSNDDSPILSILLCFLPIGLISLTFIKEKIWYLWFLSPAILLPFDKLSIYRYLIVYGLTLPIYLWYIFRKKIKPSWNSVPIIDIPIIILILYVIKTLLTNPFGLGLDFFEDYYGGRGYLTILGASLVFFLLSTLNTTSKQLGKLLTWSLPILIFFTLIVSVKNHLLQSEDTLTTANHVVSGEGERESGVLTISILILQLLIIKYNIKDFLKKIWPTILGLGCTIGILISGFRSAVMKIVLMFILISILYKRWHTIIGLPLIGLLGLAILSASDYIRELPYGVQRCLAPIEFLDIDPSIRRAAAGSIDWRTEMWNWALDDRELFIKDKIWGDGFSQDIYTKKAETYFHARNMHERGDSLGNLKYAWDGQWHNATISIINCLGYIGLSLTVFIAIISIYYYWLVSKIYKNSPHKTGILYYSLLPIINVIIFPISAEMAQSYIPSLIIGISITKLLFCCAKKEGLYITKSTRKEYIPLSCRTAQAE